MAFDPRLRELIEELPRGDGRPAFARGLRPRVGHVAQPAGSAGGHRPSH